MTMKYKTKPEYLTAYGDFEDCPVECNSFAHEPMFTHDGVWDLTAFHSIPPRSGDLCQYTYHELAYACGLDEPRYPVPATQSVSLLAMPMNKRTFKAKMYCWKYVRHQLKCLEHIFQPSGLQN